jgi:hypothetical protein
MHVGEDREERVEIVGSADVNHLDMVDRGELGLQHMN